MHLRYRELLRRIHSRYGTGKMDKTSNVELKKMMDGQGLVPNEVGTILDYEANSENGEWKGPPFAIYNTDDGPPGIHWFAVHEGYVYDPFGDDKSKSQEQPYSDKDCGQRCVAYLLLCKRHGNKSIMM